MAIRQLSLTDFRNLRSTTLDFDNQLNLISGDNGSGKTSLLEAIFVLCQARSFRTHQLKQCVHHDKSGFLLFGRFDGYKAGLAKNDRNLEIRIDGQGIKRRSDLVRQTPINIVNSASFQLIDGPPQVRRSFLDWCLFHVEPSYVDNWNLFQHALRQRNKLLKSRTDMGLLQYWDRHLCEPSMEINRLRQKTIIVLKKALDSELSRVLSGLKLDIEFIQGWPDDTELIEAMQFRRERDVRAGFTSVGIHRADLRLSTDGNAVSDVLSRGQGKRVCVALLLAALRIVSQASQQKAILLIDDLHSELDTAAQESVYAQLSEIDLQLIISNIDPLVPPALKAKEFKKFHVEHGTIKPRNFS